MEWSNPLILSARGRPHKEQIARKAQGFHRQDAKDAKKGKVKTHFFNGGKLSGAVTIGWLS
ncbi:MAG TPA: hypothetical protein VFR02_01230 [bacterium]|nr:hypothetical protein [bacterium]